MGVIGMVVWCGWRLRLLFALECHASRVSVGSTGLPVHVAVHGAEGSVGDVIGAEDSLAAS